MGAAVPGQEEHRTTDRLDRRLHVDIDFDDSRILVFVQIEFERYRKGAIGQYSVDDTGTIRRQYEKQRGSPVCIVDAYRQTAERDSGFMKRNDDLVGKALPDGRFNLQRPGLR